MYKGNKKTENKKIPVANKSTVHKYSHEVKNWASKIKKD